MDGLFLAFMVMLVILNYSDFFDYTPSKKKTHKKTMYKNKKPKKRYQTYHHAMNIKHAQSLPKRAYHKPFLTRSKKAKIKQINFLLQSLFRSAYDRCRDLPALMPKRAVQSGLRPLKLKNL